MDLDICWANLRVFSIQSVTYSARYCDIFKETESWKASLLVLAQNQFVANGLAPRVSVRPLPELYLGRSLFLGKLKNFRLIMTF